MHSRHHRDRFLVFLHTQVLALFLKCRLSQQAQLLYPNLYFLFLREFLCCKSCFMFYWNIFVASFEFGNLFTINNLRIFLWFDWFPSQVIFHWLHLLFSCWLPLSIIYCHHFLFESAWFFCYICGYTCHKLQRRNIFFTSCWVTIFYLRFSFWIFRFFKWWSGHYFNRRFKRLKLLYVSEHPIIIMLYDVFIQFSSLLF